MGREKDHLLAIDLSLFDGAAVGGEGGDMGSASGGTSEAPTAAGRETTGGIPTAPSDAGKGKESAQSGRSDAGRADPAAAQERRRAFLELVTGQGEYKDVFNEQVQRIINQRFKQTKGLEEQLSRTQPIIDMLMERYRITDGDTGKLLRAIAGEERPADGDTGMNGRQYEQLRRLEQLRREDLLAREARRRQYSREYTERQMRTWFDDAQAVKEVYPDFDLNTEVRDPQFVSLLRHGIPLRHAYEVIHMDDVKAMVEQQAAQRTEKQVVDGIRAKGSRPPENGTAGQSAFTVKGDISKLTAKDRAQLAQRAAKGEIITF